MALTFGDPLIATATLTAPPDSIRWLVLHEDSGVETPITASGGGYALAAPSSTTRTLTFRPTLAGWWRVRYEAAAGDSRDSGEARIYVVPSRFPSAQ